MEYKDKVQFFLVYTREIHPTNDDSKSSRRRGGPPITQHETLEDRKIAADKCMKGLKLTIPTLLDTMDNTFLKAYGGIPAGTCVVDIDGKVAYWNRGAPNGCKPDEARKAIKKLLEAGGAAVPTKWAAVKVPQEAPAKTLRQKWY